MENYHVMISNGAYEEIKVPYKLSLFVDQSNAKTSSLK